MCQSLSTCVDNNLEEYLHQIANEALQFFINIGGFISMMVRIYSGLALNPLLFTMHPRNFASVARKLHLFGFSFSPNLQSAMKSCSSLPKCLDVDQVVINVGGYHSTRHDRSQSCYASGEDLSGGCKTEGQTCLLVASVLCKFCFVVITFVDGNLPVTIVEIK